MNINELALKKIERYRKVSGHITLSKEEAISLILPELERIRKLEDILEECDRSKSHMFDAEEVTSMVSEWRIKYMELQEKIIKMRNDLGDSPSMLDDENVFYAERHTLDNIIEMFLEKSKEKS